MRLDVGDFWEAPDIDDTYYDDGRQWETYETPHDIIAEWSDDPVLNTSTTGFTVPLEAPEFGGKLEVTTPTLDDLYAAKCMVETGVCTINEVRSRLGFPPIHDGHHLAAA